MSSPHSKKRKFENISQYAPYEPIGHIPEILDCVMGFMNNKELYRGPLFVNRQWYEVAERLLNPIVNRKVYAAALMTSVKLGDLERVDLLLKYEFLYQKYLQAREYNICLIQNAAKLGHTEIVHRLLQEHWVIPQLALLPAVANCHEDIVKLLVNDDRVDVNFNNFEVFLETYDHDYHEFLELDRLVDDVYGFNEDGDDQYRKGDNVILDILMKAPESAIRCIHEMRYLYETNRTKFFIEPSDIDYDGIDDEDCCYNPYGEFADTDDEDNDEPTENPRHIFEEDLLKCTKCNKR